MKICNTDYPMLLLVYGYMVAVQKSTPLMQNDNRLDMNTRNPSSYNSSVHFRTSMSLRGSRSCTVGRSSTFSGHCLSGATCAVLVLVLSAGSPGSLLSWSWGWRGAYPSAPSSTRQLLLQLDEIAKLMTGAVVHRRQKHVFLVAAQVIAKRREPGASARGRSCGG